MKTRVRSLVVVGLVVGLFGAVHLTHQDTIRSASLQSVSVTLSNPRISFRGSLAGTNTVGGSIVNILTSGNHPSLSTEQLNSDDVVAIGEAGSLGTYTVATVNSSSQVSLTSALAAGDADLNDDVIASQSATQTVRFTTANAIPNGRFRILVPALTNNNDAADGIPDAGKFDFGASAPTVTCPTDFTNYDFVTGTASASAITFNGADYHAFECAYSGTGGVTTAFDGTTHDAISIASLINPAPNTGHTAGTADSYTVVVQHIDANFNVVDTTSAAVGVIEAVRVTATVAPTISFSIAGVTSGATRCGVTTDVTTTPTTVPFGELSLSAFADAAQTLTVSTNGVNGYSVTARENDQLGKDGGTCVGDNTGTSCIRDTIGNGGAMSHTASAEWTNTAAKGFGYSIENADAAATAFLYTTNSGNCTGTYCARQFADTEGSQAAVQLFSSTTVADSQNIEVCYRLIPDVTTAAGNYENSIIYTATATF